MFEICPPKCSKVADFDRANHVIRYFISGVFLGGQNFPAGRFERKFKRKAYIVLKTAKQAFRRQQLQRGSNIIRDQNTYCSQSYTDYQSSTSIPTRYAFSSTSVCMEMPFPLPIVSGRAMHTGCGQPCSKQSTVFYRPRPHVSADKPASVVSASSVQELGTGFHRQLYRDPSLSFDNFCRRFKTAFFNRAYYASQCAIAMDLTRSSGRYKCTNLLSTIIAKYSSRYSLRLLDVILN